MQYYNSAVISDYFIKSLLKNYIFTGKLYSSAITLLEIPHNLNGVKCHSNLLTIEVCFVE